MGIVLQDICLSMSLLVGFNFQKFLSLLFSIASVFIYIATITPRIKEVGVQQDPPATAEGFGHAVQTAIKASNLARVQCLLDQWRLDASIPGPSPEDINYLVPRAAENNGEPEILEYLLSQGGEVSSYTIGRTTSINIIQIFMKHSWKADNTILLNHVSHIDLVSFFLSRGVDAKILTAGSGPPLVSAAYQAPLESIKLLLSHGAPLGSGSTAVNTAAQGDVPDRIPVMAYLLEYGGDINGLAEGVPRQQRREERGGKGTSLHSAAKGANEEVRRWLLEHGSDPEIGNEVEKTHAQWAKRYERDEPEWMLRVRRAINQKTTMKREKEEKEIREKMRESMQKPRNAEQLSSSQKISRWVYPITNNNR